MIPIEQEKVAILVPPQLDTTGAPASLTYMDTKGYGHLRVEFIICANDIATTAAPALYECDTTDGTFTAITDAELAAAISATHDGTVSAIDVDLTNGTRKRYIEALITCGTTTTDGTALCVIGRLSRKSLGEHSGLATPAGLTELVSVS